MNVDLTPEQEELRSATRRFLERECPLRVVSELERDPLGYSPKLWAEMGSLGLTALSLPGAFGGSDLGMIEVVTVAREMGRVLLPSPYVSTALLSGGILSALGTEEQKRRYLPRIACGETVLAFAMQEAGGGLGRDDVRTCASPDPTGGFTLRGHKRFVEYAAAAERILVVASMAGHHDRAPSPLVLLLVDPNSPGVSLSPIRTLARDRQFHVQFNDVRVPAADVIAASANLWPAVQGSINRAIVAFSATMLGAAERAQELAMDYACQRIQFGKPIAAFQVIQHYLAQMVIENTAVETLLYYAAWTLDKGAPACAEVARAKLAAGNAVRFATSKSAEIYGGMGFVDEVDIAYYLRRGKQWQLQMGDPRYWEEVLVHAVYGSAAA